MKFFYTPNSPYARIARVAARESRLISRLEEVAVRTRAPETSYFEVTPPARVPVLEDGPVRLADTRDICGYFDLLSGRAHWLPQEGTEARFLRHVVSGFLDGVAVWLRENGRATGERSDSVMEYEQYRARRVLGWVEPRWTGREEGGFTALCLACAVDIAKDRGMARDWDEFAPGVMGWAHDRAQSPGMRETAPGPA